MNRKWLLSVDAVPRMLSPRHPLNSWLGRAILLRHFAPQQRWISCSAALLRSHYDSLGVTPSATQNDIKQAYYKLSKLYHPDKNKGSEVAAEKFRDITAAYEVLGNYRLRKLYDKGILHTAGRQFASEAPTAAADHTEDDAQTRFYKKRMTRTHAPTATGRTPIYDFDEWSRNHYGSRFDQKMKAEERFKKKAEREEIFKTRLQHEYIIFPLLFVCVMYCVIVFQEGTYDAPKPVTKSEP
ncbi:dnaJ homolog subfamily C member 30, mitochondrial [Anopheles arabiensis]|nr:dnaJ homolog subfamily C member 30, mitochondrial [Anopheles arabiensis]XP_041765180.1 dnaJ homolog subfamily C member 30, mitochondrial-like [Anopheles merus]XP_041786993.1 dnaJ homolog subfamily C member 30, mitochondrial-like [Anopheles merus]XP_310260.6 dnaJ homolog subfamily C member 30, mitochondrial [Anopheles gambiae]